MIPLKYKNNNLEKYYELIIQSRNEGFIREIDWKCNNYLGIPFQDLVCAPPEELKQLCSNLKKQSNYKLIKKDFKFIASSKENNYMG